MIRKNTWKSGEADLVKQPWMEEHPHFHSWGVVKQRKPVRKLPKERNACMMCKSKTKNPKKVSEPVKLRFIINGNDTCKI